MLMLAQLSVKPFCAGGGRLIALTMAWNVTFITPTTAVQNIRCTTAFFEQTYRHTETQTHTDTLPFSGRSKVDSDALPFSGRSKVDSDALPFSGRSKVDSDALPSSGRSKVDCGHKKNSVCFLRQ